MPRRPVEASITSRPIAKVRWREAGFSQEEAEAIESMSAESPSFPQNAKTVQRRDYLAYYLTVAVFYILDLDPTKIPNQFKHILESFKDGSIPFCRYFTQWKRRKSCHRTLKVANNHSLLHRVNVSLSVIDTATLVALRYVIGANERGMRTAVRIFEAHDGFGRAASVIQRLKENQNFHVVHCDGENDIFNNTAWLHPCVLAALPTSADITLPEDREAASVGEQDTDTSSTASGARLKSHIQKNSIEAFLGLEPEISSLRTMKNKVFRRETVLEENGELIAKMRAPVGAEIETISSHVEKHLKKDAIRVLSPADKMTVRMWISAFAPQLSKRLEDIDYEEDTTSYVGSKRRKIKDENPFISSARKVKEDLYKIVDVLEGEENREAIPLRMVAWQATAVMKAMIDSCKDTESMQTIQSQIKSIQEQGDLIHQQNKQLIVEQKDTIASMQKRIDDLQAKLGTTPRSQTSQTFKVELD